MCSVGEAEGGGVMRVIIVESPYKSTSELELQFKLAYARALLDHVLKRGDCPLASHLLYTQVLDDRDVAHRKLGISAGLAPLKFADGHAFGVDLGISDGMRQAMEIAKTGNGPEYEEISLPEWHGAWIVQDATSEPMRELIARYAPKWHVHEKR